MARGYDVSRVRPIVRTALGTVVAWTFRLTLEEFGVSAFDDITVSADSEKPFDQWAQHEVQALMDTAIAPVTNPDWSTSVMSPVEGPSTPMATAQSAVANLNRILDQRIATVERPDLDWRTLAP